MLLFIAYAILWGQHADWYWYVIGFLIWLFKDIKFE